MNICVKNMHIERFKGLDRLDISFGPGRTDIYGDNATGKTTVMDAFTWLLFGRDSLGQAVFGIKPVDGNGDVAAHGAESAVEAVLDVDGRSVTLRKAYAEKWTKKRGSSTAVFDGHITKYFVDGVPETKTKYGQFVSSLIDEKLFRLLTDPAWFAVHMDWKERRALLIQLSGAVTDETVLAAYPEYADLAEEIRSLGADRLLSKLAAERTRVNKVRDEIPVRIDEMMHGPAFAEISEAEESAGAEADAEALAAVREKLAALDAAGPTAQIAQLGAQIADIRARRTEIAANARIAYEKAQSEYSRRVSELDLQIVDARRQADSLFTEADARMAERDALRDAYRARAKSRWNGETVCPTCGQDLPDEYVEKARAAFNVARSEALTDMAAKGQELNACIEAETEKLAALLESIEQLEAARKMLGKPEEPQIEQIPEMQESYREMCGLETRRKAVLQGASAPNAERNVLARKAADLELSLQKHREALARAEAQSAVRARIEELSAREKEAAREAETMDAKCAHMEAFIRTRSVMAESAVNGMFSLVRFRLFRTQVNGETDECCDVTAGGVPYADLNSAMRVNAGLDIIRTLSAHFGVHVPVFVDNAESVTSVTGTGGQMIRLVVSEPDKTLRIQEVA